MQRVISIFSLFFISLLLSAQDKVSISKPVLSFSEDKLLVKYDITGCGRGENVNIIMKVTNSKGKTLKPVFVEGDLGKMVPCGLGKSITWDIAKDSIKMDDEISVVVEGEKYNPPASEVIYNGPKKLTRGNILFSSIFVPGLGMKKASGHSCYFAFSGLVYGGTIASVYFNLRSSKLKKDYTNASGQERENLYDDWQNAYNTAKFTAFAAGGIWVANMIWSAIIPIKENAKTKTSLYFMPDSRNNLLFGARINF